MEKKQVEKCDLFWDNAPTSSAKFKYHKYLENVSFEGTSNAVSILENCNKNQGGGTAFASKAFSKTLKISGADKP